MNEYVSALFFVLSVIVIGWFFSGILLPDNTGKQKRMEFESNRAAHIIDSLYENKGTVTHATYKELMQFIDKHK